jgi:hypothetical protein
MSFIPLGILAASGAGGGGSYESIATLTGNGSTNSVTFSSIPSGFQHLQIRILAKDTTANTNNSSHIRMRLNGDTGSNYTDHQLYGDGSAAAAVGNNTTNNSGQGFWACGYMPGSDASVANMHAVSIIDLHDYVSTTRNKTARIFTGANTNNTNDHIFLTSGVWLSTAAVTSVTLLSVRNFTSTTVFSLYGIKGA